MSAATFCWQCGKKLERRHGELVFREVLPYGIEEPVRVHVECAKNLPGPEPDYAQQGTKRAVRKYLSDLGAT